MFKSNEIKFGDCFKLPNPGLRSYFDRVRTGQPEVYRAPFAGKRTPEKVLAEWNPHLQKIADKWPTLLAFEDDLKSKVGPMSVMKPLAERMGDIDNYYDLVKLDGKPLSDRAIKAVVNEFKAIKGLHPRSQSKTIANMRLNTNSGAPEFTDRKDVLNSTVPVELVTPYVMVLGPRKQTWGNTAVLGWRGQEGGPRVEDVKQRVVWMFSFGTNIMELTMYQPLIEGSQKFNLVPAWVSMEAVDLRITRMFDTKDPSDDVVCTDFSKFDQHFNSNLQKAAKDILTCLSDGSRESIDWLNNVFPIKYNIPLAYDYGKIRKGPHGMGSGSGGTNGDETLSHRGMQYEAAQNAGQRLNPNSQCHPFFPQAVS